MGGIVGLKTAAMLTGDSLQTTEDNVKKVAAALNQGGDAVMGWDVVQGEFNFQLDRASQALNVLMITLGQKLLPLLTPIVEGFTAVIQTVTNWVSGMDAASSSGNIFAGILSGIGVSSTTANNILAALGDTFSFLKDIFGEVANVLSIVFGGAIKFISQLIGSFINDDLVQLIAIFNNILSYFDGFGQTISDFFTNLSEAGNIWGQNLGINFANGITSVIGQVLDAVVQMVVTIEDYIGFQSPTRKGPGSKAHTWGPALVTTLADGMTASVSYLDDASKTVAQHTGTGNSAPLQLSSNTSGLTSGVSAIGKQLDAVCSTHAKAASQCASDTLTNGLAKELKSNASAVGAAADHVGAQLHKIPTHAAAAAKKTKQALANLPEPAPTQAAVDSIGKILDQIPQAAQKAADKAKNAIKGIFGPPEGARQLAVWIENTFNDIVNFLKPGLAYIVNSIQTQIVPAFRMWFFSVQTLMSNIKDFIQFAGPILVGAVLSAVAAIGKWIIQSGILKTIWDAVIAGIKTNIQIATALVNWIDNIVIAVTRWITSGKAAKDIAPIWKAMGDTFQNVLSIIKQNIEGAQDAFKSIWGVVQTQLIPALANLAETFKPVAMAVAEIVVGILELLMAITKWLATSGAIKVIWTGIADAMKVFISIVSIIINAISTALQPVFKQLADTWESQVKPALTHLMAALMPLLPFLEDIAKFIGGVLLIALGLLVGAITGIIKGIGGLLQGIIQALGGIIQFVSGFIQFFIGMWSFFMDIITGKWSKLGQDLATAWQGFLDMFHGLADVFYGIWKGMVDGVVGLVSGFVQGVIDFFTNLYNDLVGHSLIPDTVNGIMDWWKKIPAFIQSLLSNLVKWIVTQWDTIKNDATTAWSAITKAISDALDKAKTWIASWASGMVDSFKTWGSNMMTMFGQGISSAWTSVQNTITGAAQWVKNVLGFSSPPKQGPLADSDTYMPNMVNMFAMGVNANAYKLTSATDNMASGVNNSFSKMNLDVNTNISAMTNTINTAKSSVSASMTSMKGSVTDASSAINQHMQLIGDQSTQTASQVQDSSTQMQGAMQGVSQGAQTTMWTVTNANDQIDLSASRTAAAHSTLKNTITQNSAQMAQAAQNSVTAIVTANNGVQTEIQTTNRAVADGSANLQWYAANAKAQSQQAQTSMLAARNAEDDTIAYLNNGQMQSALVSLGSQATNEFNSIVASAYSVASQVALLLGHSKPKLGPLQNDDQWGKHFVQNIVSGMQEGMPGLQSATREVAGALAGVLPSNTIRITADSSLAGSLTNSSNQPMIIYNVMDGKVISKVVTQYQTRELRVQGIIRSV